MKPVLQILALSLDLPVPKGAIERCRAVLVFFELVLLLFELRLKPFKQRVILFSQSLWRVQIELAPLKIIIVITLLLA